MSLSVVVLDDVEDEALMLAGMVREAYDEEGLVVHALGSIGELVSYLSTNDMPDVLFIDIDLGAGNGIDLVGQLSLGTRTQVVYVSGLDDFYTRVYDTPHASYVRKPLSRENVRLALGQAIERRRKTCAPPLVLRHDHITDVIRPEDITYIESDRRNVIVHTGAGAHRAYGKLSGSGPAAVVLCPLPSELCDQPRLRFSPRRRGSDAVNRGDRSGEPSLAHLGAGGSFR